MCFLISRMRESRKVSPTHRTAVGTKPIITRAGTSRLTLQDRSIVSRSSAAKAVQVPSIFPDQPRCAPRRKTLLSGHSHCVDQSMIGKHAETRMMRRVLERADLARSQMAQGGPCDTNIDHKIYGHIADNAKIKVRQQAFTAWGYLHASGINGIDDCLGSSNIGRQ